METMAQIHILSSETIDKIAAGEVVERPSSVVKELVENAIDAGATAITVEAKEGGIEFIRVTDNGSGMEKSQLRSAFLRHATSKIENAEDLIRISSLGFRGEALSSIAAVSKVELITKTRDQLTGTRMLLEGAAEKSFEEIGAPDGTTFIMRNLFFNTPVRRKFLKQPATEGSYITDLMEHLALSRPDISFKFLLGNQTRFHTSGNGDLREVIYRIYGRDVASSLVPVQMEQNGIRVEGYLGKPILVRSNRNFEIYYINGRFIRSAVIAKAIEEGYREYLMQHKFPLCVLHITMDTGLVDVNVHPTKMDVRFSDTMSFCSDLAGVVQRTLKAQEMIPAASLEDDKEERRRQSQERRLQQKERMPEPFEQGREQSGRVKEDTPYQAEKPRVKDFRQNPVWSRVLGEKASVKEAAQEKAQGQIQENVQEKAVERDTETLPQREQNDFFVEAPEPEEMVDKPQAADPVRPPESRQESLDPPAALPAVLAKQEPQPPEESSLDAKGEPSQVRQSGPDTGKGQDTAAVQMNLFEEKLLSVENRSRYRIIGQVFDTYWLVQFEEKLFMIDQHAAHEKVKYERLMKQFHARQVLSQTLLPPIIVTLTGQEEAVLKQYREVFEELGFEVESFGGNEYALRTVPVDLYGCSEREMFLEVLDELGEGVRRSSFQVVEEKIASMSCKAAVKGNNRLSAREAEKLIDELLTLENPYNCPHGRPTIIVMSRQEMEKKFKRIV